MLDYSQTCNSTGIHIGFFSQSSGWVSMPDDIIICLPNFTCPFNREEWQHNSMQMAYYFHTAGLPVHHVHSCGYQWTQKIHVQMKTKASSTALFLLVLGLFFLKTPYPDQNSWCERTRLLVRWVSLEASCGRPLSIENCFIFQMLPYKSLIWAGSIAHFGRLLFKF